MTKSVEGLISKFKCALLTGPRGLLTMQAKHTVGSILAASVIWCI